jgi:hypothetical protein
MAWNIVQKHSTWIKVNLIYTVISVLNYATRHGNILGNEVYLHTFLTSVLDRGQWLASRSGRFTARKEALGNNCTEGWVGPKTIEVTLVNEISFDLLGSEPRPIAQ